MSTRKTSPNAGYVAYYRVSTKQQGESGLGLEAQRQAVAHLAKHLPILAEFTEVESGKRHVNRPQLLAALACAKKERAILLIAKLDRLARNVHFISGLMESGVEFQAADLPQANKLTVHIMAAMAEFEREMISTRTKAGLTAAKAEIAAHGSRVSRRSGKPYTKHGNPRWAESIAMARAARLPPVPAAQVVALMQERRAAGDSLRAIAAHLNGLGLKTTLGNRWYASTVRKALSVIPGSHDRGELVF
jgi:DNA invertase Pin-like site-specific DNA recombinase